MKEIVLLTTKYSENRNNAWLTNELAYSFSDDGHKMTVVVFSWMKDDPRSSVKEDGDIKVVRIKLHSFFYNSGFFGTALKVFMFPWYARLVIGKEIKKCDLLIANTPCITILGLSQYFKKKYSSFCYLVLWDFFPFYLKDLGKIRNNFFFSFFKFLEEKMYASFDKIGCMTKGNIVFLKNNFPKINVDRAEILPLWTEIRPLVKVNSDDVRRKYGIALDKKIVVYGGAMSIVQELDNILNLANECRDLDVEFLFVGKGSEKERLVSLAQKMNLNNVQFIDYVPRDEYEGLIQACDVGVISLSGNLSVPSFPSKSIDYFKAALPVLASIDSFTDFGDVLENEIGAGYFVMAGEIEKMKKLLISMIGDESKMKAMGEAGRRYYENNFDVKFAKKIIFHTLSGV